MRRSVLVGFIAMLTVLCFTTARAWQIIMPPLDILIMPGVSEVHVVAPLFGQHMISYQVADTSWRAVLDKRLLESGQWRPNIAYPYTNYFRSSQIGFVSLNEMIAVTGSSTHVEIAIYRHIQVFGKWFL
jgi:hypothetical protein